MKKTHAWEREKLKWKGCSVTFGAVSQNQKYQLAGVLPRKVFLCCVCVILSDVQPEAFVSRKMDGWIDILTSLLLLSSCSIRWCKSRQGWFCFQAAYFDVLSEELGPWLSHWTHTGMLIHVFASSPQDA